MASAFQGLEFVIDGKRANILQRNIPKINNLFKVDISFKNHFPIAKKDEDVVQWIHIKGSGNDCNNAKNYIIALTSPERNHCVQGLKFHPLFTEEKREEIERSSQAVLTFEDGCEDLKMYGTDMSIAIAQSLIDDIIFKFRKDQNSDLDDYVVIDKDYIDCLRAVDENTIALRAVHVAKNSQGTSVSPTRQSNMTTHDSPSVMSPLSQSGQRTCDALPKTKPPLQDTLRPNLHQNGQGLRQQKENCGQQTFQSHKIQQASSLWQLAINRDYRPEDIEKCLSRFDMNNIVQPVEFFKTLDEIKKTSRQGALKVVSRAPILAQSPARDSNIDLNDSVIYLGVEAPKIAASPIVISDDEDIEMDTADVGSSGTSRNTQGVSGAQMLNQNKLKPSHLPQRDISRAAPAASSSQTTESHEHEEVPEPKQYRKDLRYIVIDGSNVAMAHGGNKVFSVRGIDIAVKFFKDRGHDRITVFVPESKRYGDPSKGVFNTEPIRHKYLLEKLNNEGILKFTPARRVDGRLIASYDDRYILKLASQEDGVIVSNDLFRDLAQENPIYKKVVDANLLQFLFVGDEFMPPDDPFGRHGCGIDDFLKCPAFRGSKSKVPNKETKKAVQMPVAKGKINDQRNGPRRSREQTQKLYDQLIQVFPEDKQSMSVYQVLENHSTETDLVKLTNYVMNALFS